MIDIQQIIPLFILIPLLGVFLLSLIARKQNFNADIIFFLIVLILTLLCGCLFAFQSKAFLYVYYLGAGQLPESITFIMDGLSAFFLSAVYLITFCIMLFSLRFMDNRGEKWKFYALFFLLLTGVNGVIIAGDIFTLYLFMEVAAIASYALVCFSLESKALAFGFKYMIKGVMASAFIFLGIAICYCYTSTLALADIANQIFLRQNIASDPAMGFVILFIQALLFLGFLLKSGILPFNSWLLDIHRATLVPVTAMLAAVIIPALGIYPFIRIYFNIIGTNEQSLSVVRVIAMGAMLGAVLWSFKKNSGRQMIAYHTISEFGLAVLAMAIASPWAIFGGLLQLLNTQITLALVNCNAGLIDYINFPDKTRHQSGYSFKYMPKAFILTIFSSLAFISFPPFLGFWSKLIIIVAAWKAGYKVYALGVMLVVCLGAISFIKKQLFRENSGYKYSSKAKKIKLSMAMALLIMIGLSLGLNMLLASENKDIFVRPAMRTILSTTKYSKAVFKAENEE